MNKNPAEWICCALASVLTVVQTNEIFQLVSLILTCIATVLAIAFTIYKWVKKAKADGKIDAEEVEELAEIIKDGAESIKEVSDKSQKEKK